MDWDAHLSLLFAKPGLLFSQVRRWILQLPWCLSHPIFSWKKWALVKRTYNAISIQYKKVKLASTVQTDNGAFVSSLLGALSSTSGSAATAFPANPTCGSCKGHFDMSGLHCTRPSFKKLSNSDVIGNPMLNVGIVRPLATSKVLHHIIYKLYKLFLV